MYRRFKSVAFACFVLAGLLVSPATAGAQGDPPDFSYETPVFGLNSDGAGGLLVADYGAGVVRLGADVGEIVVPLVSVSDAVAVDGDFIALTAEPFGDPAMFPDAQKLFRVSDGEKSMIADLWAFEQANNPDAGFIFDEMGQPVVNSNPFDLARLASSTLVADAGANAVLQVHDDGQIEVVAVLTAELATTEHLTDLVDCADPPEELAFICDLPPAIPAEPVATSVAVGPDGDYFMGELKGFPGTPGLSRVWTVAAGTTDAVCPSAACTEALPGVDFTSIVDLAFTSDGTLLVVELDEASWLAAEEGLGVGGTVNACDLTAGSCHAIAEGLTLPIAATVDEHGDVFVAVSVLIPGAADVIRIWKEFTDDNGSVHEHNIEALAAAGITLGCNPPANDQFCPDDLLTRGQFAAMLRRALSLPGSDVDAFIDDDASIFEGDINAVAAAGITKGCNPPANDNYCPDDLITRAQAASMLARALDLGV